MKLFHLIQNISVSQSMVLSQQKDERWAPPAKIQASGSE